MSHWLTTRPDRYGTERTGGSGRAPGGEPYHSVGAMIRHTWQSNMQQTLWSRSRHTVGRVGSWQVAYNMECGHVAYCGPTGMATCACGLHGTRNVTARVSVRAPLDERRADQLRERRVARRQAHVHLRVSE